MWHVLCLHEIGILASTNQKTVYWWRHRVLKMCSLKSTGAKTPYMFKYKCYMYYVFIFSLKLVSSNQKTVFWWRHTVLKICPSYSTGPQTPWSLATLTFSSLLNEYLFLAHFEFILAHCASFVAIMGFWPLWVSNTLLSFRRRLWRLDHHMCVDLYEHFTPFWVFDVACGVKTITCIIDPCEYCIPFWVVTSFVAFRPLHVCLTSTTM